MSLLPPSVTIAAEIDAINREALSYLRTQAQRAYELINTPEQEQAILDVLGANAAAALQTYGAIYQLLATLGQAENVLPPNLSIWQINQDGTVTFTPPTP